jgi:putative ABC transport system permease protein
MGRSRWMKILRDLWGDRARTLLVLLSLVIGMFAVSIVIDAYAILIREMNYNYLRTDPSSAILWVAPLDEAVLARVRQTPGIAAADVRSTIGGRIRTGENLWKTITLFVVPDFQKMPVDRIYPESGAWPPSDGDILMERAAVRLFSSKIGEPLLLSIPGGTGGTLRFAGTAYAPGLAPAWMEGELYGFITTGALARLGGSPSWQELRVQFADVTTDQEAVRANARSFADTLAVQGYTVSRIEVPKPGAHPHAAQMGALLSLLEMFGLLALILSSILAATMISAMMSREIRQIGVMKALGASPSQVAGVYFAMVGLLGLLSLAISLPAGLAAARAYAQFAANILNFNIFRDDVPLSYWWIQVAAGGLFPLVVAAIPILRGSRISIQEAISDYGVRVSEFGRGWFDGLLARVRFLPSFARLGFRNAFRRRTRAMFIILTLMAAGTSFITAMNVAASMDGSAKEKFDAIQYDAMIIFNRPYTDAQLDAAFAGVSGLQRMEVWGGAQPAIERVDGSIGNTFTLIAPKAETKLMNALPVAKGRWLLPGDTNTIVINQGVQSREPAAKVGNMVRMRMLGKESVWKIVGVVDEFMAPPTAYVNREAFDAAIGASDSAGIVVVRSLDRSPTGVAAVTRSLEARISASPLDVAVTRRMADGRDMIVNHLWLLVSFLVMMSVLVLFVGGLSLASTLSINVLERRREIGVMRASGASGWDIAGIVTGEALIVSLSAWILSILVSNPIGEWITWNFGMTFLQAPLTYSYSVTGALEWLGIVIVFAALASFLPAWDASRLPVQKVLAYE